jgi:arsenate reductase|tara:strand:+ start:833 stop:1105 length:273 start_codon:yes stop_codon:yes gene_type:complete
MKEGGVEFEEYRYLDLGIHADDLEILSNLENVIRTADLEDKESIDLSNQTEVMSLLKRNPRVLQRPILVRGEKAVIGRPPEEIITLLHEV